MAGPITLDGRTWDVDASPGLPSVARMLTKADLASELSPSALLALGAVANAPSRPAAVKHLRDEFGFDSERAKAAVAVAASLTPPKAANHPIGYIAGVRISVAHAGYLSRLVEPIASEAVAPAPGLTHAEAVRAWRLGRVRPFVTSAVRSGDPSVGLVAAALLAAQHPKGNFVRTLSDAQFHTLAGRGTRLRRNVGRVLGAAYAITGVASGGLDLGHGRVSLGTSGWRLRAAPWVLPILDETNGHSVHALLQAVEQRQLDFVEPGVNPMPYPEDHRTLRDTLAAVTAYSQRLTKWTDRPMVFDGGPGRAQVLLTQDDFYMYAWVGANGRGVLVAFDTIDLVGYGLDEPGVRAALTHALGWFVDVSVSLRSAPSGTAALRRVGQGSKVSGYRYTPTPVYDRQAQQVAGGQVKPPTVTAVQSHVRQLKNRRPSAAARARAPRRLRDVMGPKDTFVRGHIKGTQGVSALDTRLSKYSMLADVIGRHGGP